MIGRRALIAAGLATGVVGLRAPARAAAAAGPVTAASLVAEAPFYIAHRGGGRNWPAMTGYAYAQATRIPEVKALEISVCITSDGVLVCNHNKTTTAMTGVPYTIINETWDTLSALRVSPRYTTNPGQPSRPFTRFDEVAERYLDDYVLFVEPKSKAATAPLLATMAPLGQPERVVWKQPVDSRRFVDAKERGFTTWGYVMDVPAHTGARLRRFAASEHIDLLGAHDSDPDDLVTEIVSAAASHGKQTIMWEISSPQKRARALALGCTGLMTSDLLGVLGTPR